MTSVFAKARTIFLSNVHGVLDRAIDLNSIGAIEQYCRDLESARQDLEGSLAEESWSLKTKTSSVTGDAKHASDLEANIKALAAYGKADSARQLAGELVKVRDRLEATKAELDDQTKTVENLKKAVSNLTVKETEMKSQLGRLRAADSSARAKSRAAAAIEAAGDAAGASGSVDNIAEKIGRKQAVADARLDRAMGSLGADASTNDARADALLAELTGGARAPAGASG